MIALKKCVKQGGSVIEKVGTMSPIPKLTFLTIDGRVII